MPTIRLVASQYGVSSSLVTVTNPSNMYTNVNSGTYATITHTNASTTAYYMYLHGFNFDDIDPSWRINSFTVKIKARVTGLSTVTTYRAKLCRKTSSGTTDITSTCAAFTSTLTTFSFTGVTADWDTIMGYGDDFGIRCYVRRSSASTQGYLYIYGAEILVDYDVPSACIVTYNGNTLSEEFEYDDINVWYNNSYILQIPSGEAETHALQCSGCLMETDVVIGSKTLSCAGTIMEDNVTIEVLAG